MSRSGKPAHRVVQDKVYRVNWCYTCGAEMFMGLEGRCGGCESRLDGFVDGYRRDAAWSPYGRVES